MTSTTTIHSGCLIGRLDELSSSRDCSTCDDTYSEDSLSLQEPSLSSVHVPHQVPSVTQTLDSERLQRAWTALGRRYHPQLVMAEATSTGEYLSDDQYTDSLDEGEKTEGQEDDADGIWDEGDEVILDESVLSSARVDNGRDQTVEPSTVSVSEGEGSEKDEDAPNHVPSAELELNKPELDTATSRQNSDEKETKDVNAYQEPTNTFGNSPCLKPHNPFRGEVEQQSGAAKEYLQDLYARSQPCPVSKHNPFLPQTGTATSDESINKTPPLLNRSDSNPFKQAVKGTNPFLFRASDLNNEVPAVSGCMGLDKPATDQSEFVLLVNYPHNKTSMERSESVLPASYSSDKPSTERSEFVLPARYPYKLQLSAGEQFTVDVQRVVSPAKDAAPGEGTECDADTAGVHDPVLTTDKQGSHVNQEADVCAKHQHNHQNHPLRSNPFDTKEAGKVSVGANNEEKEVESSGIVDCVVGEECQILIDPKDYFLSADFLNTDARSTEPISTCQFPQEIQDTISSVSLDQVSPSLYVNHQPAQTYLPEDAGMLDAPSVPVRASSLRWDRERLPLLLLNNLCTDQEDTEDMRGAIPVCVQGSGMPAIHVHIEGGDDCDIRMVQYGDEHPSPQSGITTKGLLVEDSHEVDQSSYLPVHQLSPGARYTVCGDHYDPLLEEDLSICLPDVMSDEEFAEHQSDEDIDEMVYNMYTDEVYVQSELVRLQHVQLGHPAFQDRASEDLFDNLSKQSSLSFEEEEMRIAGHEDGWSISPTSSDEQLFIITPPHEDMDAHQARSAHGIPRRPNYRYNTVSPQGEYLPPDYQYNTNNYQYNANSTQEDCTGSSEYLSVDADRMQGYLDDQEYGAQCTLGDSTAAGHTEMIVTVPVMRTRVEMSWLDHTWLLLDVTPEFSERRKIRAAIRALKSNLSLHKTPPEAAPHTDHVTRRPSLVDGLRERRESLRKEQGTLVTGDGLQRELRLLEQARNPYDEVKDEQILTQLLKKSTELDDRVKIRAALRKLREENTRNDTVSKGSPRSVKKITNGSSHHSVVEENGKKAPCYSHIDDVHVLENMLSDVADYDERRKIRGAIQHLRKQQLAAVAIKYSRNNSPDTVTSDTVDSVDNVSSDRVTPTSIISEQSDSTVLPTHPSHNPAVMETVQSRLVVTLNNPANRNSTHSEPKVDKDDVPPLPTSPPPPPRVAFGEGGHDNRESPTLEDIEQQESRVQEKNLRNMEGKASRDDPSEPPHIPVRTSSLNANRRAYPWTSTKVNLRVNGRTVSNDTDLTPNSDSDMLSTDTLPSAETGNGVGVDSDTMPARSTNDESSSDQDTPDETEQDSCTEELQTVDVNNLSTTDVAVADSPVTCHAITEANTDSDVTNAGSVTEPCDITEPCDVTKPYDVTKPCDVTDSCDVTKPHDVTDSCDVTEPTAVVQEDPLVETVSSEVTCREVHDTLSNSSDNTQSDSTSISPPTQGGGEVDLEDIEPSHTASDTNSDKNDNSTKDCDKNAVVAPTGLPEETEQPLTVESDSSARVAAQPTAQQQRPSGSEKPLVTSIADAMEVLRGRLTYLEDELDSCENFDERREIRASIREVRAQIREETLKLSQQPTKGKAVLTKTLSTQEPARSGKPLTLTRSFSSKTQGRNFLARKLKCQLGRSNSTKATASPVKEEPSAVDSDEPVFCAAPISRQYSRHDASTAPRPTDSAPVSRSSSNVSTTHTGSAPVSRTGSYVGTRPEGASRRNCRNSDNKRRFLSLEGRTLNMSKASSGYGSVSGSDEDKEEDAAPRITQPLSDVTHNDGETVTLTCKVMAGSKAKVVWCKDSKLLKNSADFKQEFDGTTASLVITEIFPDDTGEYKCVVSNAEGQAETIAYMTVLEAERPMAPSVNLSLTDMKVQDGDNVTFECQVTGTPPPKVTWYKGDRLLKDSPDFRQKLEAGVARLTLEDVFPDDNGDYVCVATNKAGQARTACTLVVKEEAMEEHEAPDIVKALQNREVLDGDQVTLTCGISGTPKPIITWYKDDKLLPNCTDFEQSYDGRTARLVIDEVFEDDTGEYKVVAKNVAGEVSMAALLDVRAKPGQSSGRAVSPPVTVPTFTSRLQDVEVTAGSTATLTCCVRGTPRPRVSWYRDGNLLRHSTAHQSYDGDSACLEVPRVRREDGGKYECVARNDRGDARCSCTLQVNDVITGKSSGFRSLSSLTSDGRDLQALKARLEGMKSRFSDEPVNGSAQSRIKELQAKLDTTATHKKTVPSLTDYTSKMPDDKKDIDSIDDEDELHKMMTATQDFEERKKLRNRMKEVREKKAEEYKKKQQEIGPQEDAVKMRQRMADSDKNRRLKEMDNLAKKQRENRDIGEHERYLREKQVKAEEERQKKLEGFKEMGRVMSQVYHAGSDVTVKLDQAKAKELKEKHFGSSGGESTTQTTKTDKMSDGSTVTTNVTTTRKTTKEGGTTTVTQTKQVTQKGSPGTTNYTIKKTSAEVTADKLVSTMESRRLPGTCGVISVRAESWNSRDGTTDNSEKTQIWGVTSSSSTSTDGEKPGLTPGGEGKVSIQRSPSAIKDMLLQWCKICTKDYENVNITNFSSSWNNGMAFAALIHHFRPVFDYKKLNPKCRRGNFKLAFDVAEKFADIAPLLDVDDMVAMKNPDWKCVFTYVQSFYRKFRDEEGAPKPKAPENET